MLMDVNQFAGKLKENQDIYDDAASLETQGIPNSSKLDDAKHQGMVFIDPTHILTTFNDAIREGRKKIYKWQRECHRKFANREKLDEVLRIALVANNGSGKSQMVIAPCAIWLCMRFIKARAVITSASGAQLDRQVGKAIAMLARAINEKFGCVVWKCNYRYLTFLPTGSTIELYATDDATKAEGYHPHEGGEEFALFVDEAKAIANIIYEAILRCNGMTRRMDVSSPGAPIGHFYDIAQYAQIEFTKVDKWWILKVTYKQCPHIKEDEVEEAKLRWGEASAPFKSSLLAEFCSVAEMLVITLEQLNKCFKNPPKYIEEGDYFGGLDLAQGGDENVLVTCRGNKILHVDTFCEEDTTITCSRLKQLIDKRQILPSNINADDGVAGKPIVDMLWRDGYRVNRLRNESTPFDKLAFANRGAETWYNFARLVQECDVILPNDSLTFKQLYTRYYSQGDVHGKILLESKRVARSKGHGSPDRADAVVLAFANKRFPLYANITESRVIRKRQSSEEILEELRTAKYSYSGLDNVRQGLPVKEEKLCFGYISNN